MEKVIIYGTKNCAFCKGAVKQAKAVCDNVEYKDLGFRTHYEELVEKNVNMGIQPHIWVTDGGSEFYVGSYPEFNEYCYNTQIPAFH